MIGIGWLISYPPHLPPLLFPRTNGVDLWRTWTHDQDLYFSFWARLRQFISRNVRRMLFLFNTLALSCRPIQSCVCLYWRHMFRYGRNDYYRFKGKLHKWIIQSHCKRLQTDHLGCIVKIQLQFLIFSGPNWRETDWPCGNLHGHSSPRDSNTDLCLLLGR